MGIPPKKGKSKAEVSKATAQDEENIEWNSSLPRVLGVVPVPELLATLIQISIQVYILYYICISAYDIRTYAIREYGRVIHEFDPWFNFRATQYLADNGWYEFFHWFDYKSWYPLGRPVGTTIYPGMQITSVALWKVLGWIKNPMSLNDVCVFVPCWFGVSATLFLGLLTYEVSGSRNAAVAASGIMAIIPAHIMRSVGGGYDNEAVAVTAMCATFFFWVRSLRNKDSWVFGVLTGMAYTYMVAVWGGFVFVLNMIAAHAAGLVALGLLNIGPGYSSNLYRAFTLFFVIGTFGATRVPVVGLTPFKSLEQLGAMSVFIVFQLIEVCEVQRRRRKLGAAQAALVYAQVFSVAALVVGLMVSYLSGQGYFGPISARVRGLFVKHTRTGNPLVDSVAEHQPASPDAYWQYLHSACYTAPVGLFLSVMNVNRWTQSSFITAYGIVAYFFSNKMARLIIIAGPVASALSGMAIGMAADWALSQLWWRSPPSPPYTDHSKVRRYATALYDCAPVRMVRLVAAAVMFMVAVQKGPKYWKEFNDHAQLVARSTSNPQIMFKGTLRDGREVMVDDYRDAYFWLRDNTPEDSRVMAWWDYGYQITGIGNRTTIADGNTWNHEHIATLGHALTSPVKDAHRIIRHLADYVLVWAGGGGDDLAKSPHLARISNSVYEGKCPGDPTCRHFGFDSRSGAATPSMQASLLFTLHQHNQRQGVSVDPNRFQEVYMSKYGKVRIFKVMSVSEKSKKWVANPKNRNCDAPGSWYCTGNYPPALDWLISQRKNFAQLEDFNVKKDKKSEEYTKQYLSRMAGEAPTESGEASAPKKPPPKKEKEVKMDKPAFTKKAAERVEWANTEDSTRMWQLINDGNIRELQPFLDEKPERALLRSEDGRGPMWWAHEKKDKDIIALLKKVGVRSDLKDAKGKTPKEV